MDILSLHPTLSPTTAAYNLVARWYDKSAKKDENWEAALHENVEPHHDSINKTVCALNGLSSLEEHGRAAPELYQGEDGYEVLDGPLVGIPLEAEVRKGNAVLLRDADHMIVGAHALVLLEVVDRLGWGDLG